MKRAFLSRRTAWRLVLLLALVTPATLLQAANTLWEIQGKKATVHLLGSVHFLQPTNYPLAKPIEAAFDRARIVVFETDIDGMKKPEAQARLMSKATLPDGQSLETILSPATYKDFTNHLAGSGLPLNSLDRFRPGMAAIVLTVMELQHLGLNPEFGVDQHLHSRAKKAAKTIQGLETIDFQIDMIVGIGANDGDQMMKTTLKDIDQTRKLFRDIVTAWQTGDSKALEKLMNQSLRDVPDLYKRLVTDRNRNWVPKITALLEGDQDALVVVGAGHLVGKENVVDLLSAKGFKPVQK